MIDSTKSDLWKRVMLGMSLGVLLGYLFGNDILFLKPLGDMYISMLKMSVIPIVFFAVLYGMVNIDDIDSFGKIGLKALIFYLTMTAVAILVGMFFGSLFQLDPSIINPKVFGENTVQVSSEGKSIYSILTTIIPRNPIQAMASGNTLQTVVFAFFVGFAILLAEEKANEVKKLVISTTNVIFQLVRIIMSVTPYGVFIIMACMVGEYGFGILMELIKLVIVLLSAFFVQYLLLGALLLLNGLNPIKFFTKSSSIQALAVATCCSKSTLGYAIENLQSKLGVSKRIASFVLPLGVSVNMTATAIYLCVCTLFFAQMAGVTFTFYQYATLFIASTIGSIGGGGFAGGGVLMMSLVLTSVGLPVDYVSLVMGIDRFLDMFRTTVNIMGDCAITVIVDKMEGTIDKKVYNE